MHHGKQILLLPFVFVYHWTRFDLGVSSTIVLLIMYAADGPFILSRALFVRLLFTKCSRPSGYLEENALYLFLLFFLRLYPRSFSQLILGTKETTYLSLVGAFGFCHNLKLYSSMIAAGFLLQLMFRLPQRHPSNISQ